MRPVQALEARSLFTSLWTRLPIGAGLAVLGAADFGCELPPQEERTSKSAAPTSASASALFVGQGALSESLTQAMSSSSARMEKGRVRASPSMSTAASVMSTARDRYPGNSQELQGRFRKRRCRLGIGRS